MFIASVMVEALLWSGWMFCGYWAELGQAQVKLEVEDEVLDET